MKTTEIIPKEYTNDKTAVQTIQQSANAFTVNSKDDMEAGNALLKEVKAVSDVITERKEKIVRPLMASLASVRDLFKPLEITLDTAKKDIKAKMLAWQIEEDARIAKEEDRIAKRIEKGTMKAETAVSKLEQLKESAPKSNIRILVKVRVVNEAEIPREYLVPDLKKITEAIIQHGLVVPGAEKYEEKSIVTGR